jgi:putative copper resistance protein D
VNQTDPSFPRSRALIGFALLTLGLVAAAIVGLNLGGGALASALEDPGPVVRWGLPLIRGAMDLSMATAIGSLGMAVFATADNSWQLRRLQLLAGASAMAWTIAAIFNILFTYLAVTGLGISSSSQFGQGLWMFVTQIALGQSLGQNLVIAALVATWAFAVEKLRTTILVFALAMVSIIPIANTGHAAGTMGHAMAVNALGLHLVAVSIWVGGLVALVVVRSKDAESNQRLTSRYSTLALLAYFVVAISGIASASVRLTSWSALFSNYGLIVLLKSATLLLLGAFGAWYRMRLIVATRLNDKRPFWVMVLLELGLMGVAMGLATALGRTAPPEVAVNLANPTPAQILTGEKLPPELTAARWVTEFKPDLVWLVVCLLGVGFYLAGVMRLRRRGDSWPIIRTLSWVTGMLLLAWITSGSMNVYEQYLFSVHMIAHMMLTMAVPLLLVPGAPVTLISRAVVKRNDNSMGAREWVLWAVHTPYARLISNPIFAAVNFAASLAIFYFTPLFALATKNHLGHEWMIVHFLITGYLFVQALVGVDPGPKNMPHAIKLMLLIGTLTFHAFFGLALMQGSGLLLADWFGAMGRTWGQLPLADQQTGGAIAWGIGELPAAALTLIVSVQWSRSDARDAKRLDRASDRGGNQDIEAYNQMLSQLAARRERAQQRHDS